MNDILVKEKKVDHRCYGCGGAGHGGGFGGGGHHYHKGFFGNHWGNDDRGRGEMSADNDDNSQSTRNAIVVSPTIGV